MRFAFSSFLIPQKRVWYPLLIPLCQQQLSFAFARDMSGVAFAFEQELVSSDSALRKSAPAAATYQNPFFNANRINCRRSIPAAAVEKSPFDNFHEKNEDVVSAILGENLIGNRMSVASDLRCLSYPLSLNSSLLSPISLSTLTSPKASEAYLLSTDKRSFQRMKIIEELIESERLYMDSLRLLSTSYIEPLFDVYKCKIGIPIVLIDTYIKILIINHTKLLNEMEFVYFSQSNGNTPLEIALVDVKQRNFALEIAKEMSDLIAKYSISSYIYEQYCIINDQILKLMTKRDMRSNFFENFETAKFGFEIFTELVVQSENHHMDLSFISLFQKPISRIPKYKLILESLMSQLDNNNIAEYELQSSIALNLETVKSKLNEINENIKNQQDMLRKYHFMFESLNSSIVNIAIMRNHFKGDEISSGFSFEVFGYPILSGGLALITISQSSLLNCKYRGCILFKSHLFVIDSRHHRGTKFDIKFMIPLQCCKLNGEMEGLVVSGDFPCFKITFEFQYQLFELLFVSSSPEEINTWIKYLDILINNVNGPYSFDYSLSNEKNLIHLGDKLAPCDVCLNELARLKLGSFKTNFNGCYFKELRSVTVIQENNETIQGGDMVILNKRERLDMEIRFKSIWSEELLQPSKHINMNNQPYTKSNEEERLSRGKPPLTRNVGYLRRATSVFNGFLSKNSIMN